MHCIWCEDCNLQSGLCCGNLNQNRMEQNNIFQSLFRFHRQAEVHAWSFGIVWRLSLVPGEKPLVLKHSTTCPTRNRRLLTWTHHTIAGHKRFAPFSTGQQHSLHTGRGHLLGGASLWHDQLLATISGSHFSEKTFSRVHEYARTQTISKISLHSRLDLESIIIIQDDHSLLQQPLASSWRRLRFQNWTIWSKIVLQ